MKLQDTVKVNDSMQKGVITTIARLYGPNGELKQEEKVHNLVTTAGKAFLADAISGTPDQDPMSHMAIGTGNTAANASDTALDTELDRNALDDSTDSGAVNTFTASWAAGDGTGTIVEAGIFNDPTAGTMLCRAVFSAINKGALDVLEITWTVTFS